LFFFRHHHRFCFEFFELFCIQDSKIMRELTKMKRQRLSRELMAKKIIQIQNFQNCHSSERYGSRVVRVVKGCETMVEEGLLAFFQICKRPLCLKVQPVSNLLPMFFNSGQGIKRWDRKISMSLEDAYVEEELARQYLAH
jgi:hypothetical protein